MEGLPASCQIDLAIDPAAALGDLSLVDCPDRSGCQQLVIDWPNPPTRRSRFVLYSGFHDGSQFVLGYGRASTPVQGVDLNHYAAVREDGRHVVVARSPQPDFAAAYCAITTLQTVSEGFVMTLVGRDAARQSWARVLRGRYEAPAEVEPLPRDGDATTRFIQRTASDWNVTALESTPPISVFRAELDGPATEVAGGAGYQEIGAVARGTIFVSEYEGRWWVAAAGPTDSVVRPFIDLAEGESAIPRTDGDDIVWLQAFGPRGMIYYDRIELWTSPWADTRTELAPRAVARLPFAGVNGGIGMGHGRAWAAEYDDSYGIYDLATGERRAYHPPPDRALGAGTKILGPEELVIPVVLPNRSPDEATAVQIVRIDALPVEPLTFSR
ncbi:MAG: hypothetical protein IT378_08005 [Sandaracinaceae bacterium]|nr:hypothetical protein [Sandaracinaceae bacterium]